MRSMPIIGKATAARRKFQVKVAPPSVVIVLLTVPQEGMGDLSAATSFGPQGGDGEEYGMIEKQELVSIRKH